MPHDLFNRLQLFTALLNKIEKTWMNLAFSEHHPLFLKFLCFSFISLEEQAALCLSAGSLSTFTLGKKGILLTPNQRAWLNFSDYTHWSILWKLFLLNQFWTFYLTAYSQICSCRQNRSKYKLLFSDILSVHYWSWP